MRAQGGKAAPALDRARRQINRAILHRRNHAADSSGDDPLCAGAGTAGMRTRFQRAVEGGATRPLTCFVERVYFRMRLARTLVRAVADDHTFGGDHARADDRIRCRAPEPAAGVFKGTSHPPPICFDYHFSWNSAST